MVGLNNNVIGVVVGGMVQNQLPQHLLDAIHRALSATGIRDIRSQSGLAIAWLGNHVVTHVTPFLFFLENLLKLSREQAFQVSQAFLYKTNNVMNHDYFIDLEGFEKAIYTSTLPNGLQNYLINMNVWQQQKSAYEILKKVNDQVRWYFMFSNGDILKLFIEADVNRDNFISKEELGYVLEKLGLNQQNRLSP